LSTYPAWLMQHCLRTYPKPSPPLKNKLNLITGRKLINSQKVPT
jgi:hypothetical protein